LNQLSLFENAFRLNVSYEQTQVANEMR